MFNETGDYLRLEVGGQDPKRWAEFRAKFVEKLFQCMEEVMNFQIDAVNGSTVKQEIQAFASKLLEYGKEKLSKPGLDNAKTIAEVELLYSEKLKTQAEARLISAQAADKELATAMKRLRLQLGMMKAVMMMSKVDEDILFVKDIDLMIATVREIEQSGLEEA